MAINSSDHSDSKYLDMEKNDLSFKILRLTAQATKGAFFFYFIAGFGLLNTVFLITGGNSHYFLDLGINQLIMFYTRLIVGNPYVSGGIALQIASFAIQIAYSCVYILIGDASRGYNWKITLTGLAIYLVDGMVLVYLHGLFSLFVHIFCFIMIWRGYQAMKEYINIKLAFQNNLFSNSYGFTNSLLLNSPEMLWKFGFTGRKIWSYVFFVIWLIYIIWSAYL